MIKCGAVGNKQFNGYDDVTDVSGSKNRVPIDVIIELDISLHSVIVKRMNKITTDDDEIT